MDENKFLEMTNCNDCPCLNNDYEQGSSCNLAYGADLYWTKFDLISASPDCGLEIVKHSRGEYRPIKVMARKKRTDGKCLRFGYQK